MPSNRVSRARQRNRGSIPPLMGPQQQLPVPKEPPAGVSQPKTIGCSCKPTRDVPFPPEFERCVHQVTLMGRVWDGPFMKGTSEHPMIEFFLATHSFYKNEEGEQTLQTDQHRICVFKQALREQVLAHLKRGERVHLIGKLIYTRPNQKSSTKKDVVTQNRVSIFADKIIFFKGSAAEGDDNL